MWRLLRDSGYAALRSIRVSPAYSAGVLVSLAVAFGSTAAVYAVLSHVLYGQVSWRDPESLVLLGRSELGAKRVETKWSYPRIREMQRAPHQDISQVAIVRRVTTLVAATPLSPAAAYQAEFATANYLASLGIGLPIGRSDPDGDAGDPLTVIVSDALWHRYFGGNHSAVGSMLAVNGLRLRVTAVAPPGFRGVTGAADLWIPLSAISAVTGDSTALGDQYWAYTAVVRLTPTASRLSRQRELTALTRALGLQRSAHGASTLVFIPPRDATIQAALRTALFLLAGASACVFLLAALNIASLTIARIQDRRKEIALRVALGGQFGQVALTFVAEAAWLAALGSLAGLASAVVLLRIVWSMRPKTGASWVYVLSSLDAPSIGTRDIGLAFLLFSVVVTVIGVPVASRIRATLAHGSAPLLNGAYAARVAATGLSLRRTLAAAQVAIAFVLVLSALLLLGSVSRLRNHAYGFQASHILTARLFLPERAFDSTRTRMFYRRVLELLARSADVRSVGIANALPLQPTPPVAPLALSDEDARRRETRATEIRYHTVSDGYFATFGVPIRKGRMWSTGETGNALALITEYTARQLFEGNDVLGRTLGQVRSSGLAGEWHVVQVSGVTGDVQYDVPGSPPDLDVFVPLLSDPPRDAYIALRSQRPPDQLRGILTSAILEADRQALVYDVATMQQRLTEASSATSFIALLLSTYGAFALVIALVGVYSVVSYGVELRRSELAVRMAVGASSRRILAMVVREAVEISVGGILIGFIGSAAAYQLLSHYLFGVTFLDLPIQTLSIALFGMVTLGASIGPAIRAVRVDPAVVLRTS